MEMYEKKQKKFPSFWGLYSAIAMYFWLLIIKMFLANLCIVLFHNYAIQSSFVYNAIPYSIFFPPQKRTILIRLFTSKFGGFTQRVFKVVISLQKKCVVTSKLIQTNNLRTEYSTWQRCQYLTIGVAQLMHIRPSEMGNYDNLGIPCTGKTIALKLKIGTRAFAFSTTFPWSRSRHRLCNNGLLFRVCYCH